MTWKRCTDGKFSHLVYFCDCVLLGRSRYRIMDLETSIHLVSFIFLALSFAVCHVELDLSEEVGPR